MTVKSLIRTKALQSGMTAQVKLKTPIYDCFDSSISERGCVEKTRKSEKYLGIGRKVHKKHDPTNPANMKMK